MCDDRCRFMWQRYLNGGGVLMRVKWTRKFNAHLSFNVLLSSYSSRGWLLLHAVLPLMRTSSSTWLHTFDVRICFRLNAFIERKFGYIGDWKRAFLTRHENASSMVNIWKISQFVVFVFSHMNDRYGMVLVLVRLSGVSARVLLLSLIGGVQLHLQTTGRSRGSIWLKLILNKIFAYECHF